MAGTLANTMAYAQSGLRAGWWASSIGQAVGTTYELESGLASYELSKVEDEEGNRIPKDVRRKIAAGVGAINAVIEVALPDSYLDQVMRYGGKMWKKAVSSSVLRAAGEVGLSVLKGALSESAEEGLQSMVSAAGESIAKTISDGRGTSFSPRLSEEIKNALSEGLRSFANSFGPSLFATALPSSVPAIVSYTQTARQGKASFSDFARAAEEAGGADLRDRGQGSAQKARKRQEFDAGATVAHADSVRTKETRSSYEPASDCSKESPIRVRRDDGDPFGYVPIDDYEMDRAKWLKEQGAEDIAIEISESMEISGDDLRRTAEAYGAVIGDDGIVFQSEDDLNAMEEDLERSGISIADDGTPIRVASESAAEVSDSERARYIEGIRESVPNASEEEAEALYGLFENLASSLSVPVGELASSEGDLISPWQGIFSGNERMRRGATVGGTIFVNRLTGDASTVFHEMGHKALQIAPERRASVTRALGNVFSDERRTSALRGWIERHAEVFGTGRNPSQRARAEKAGEAMAALRAIESGNWSERSEEAVMSMAEASLTDRSRKGLTASLRAALERLGDAVRRIYGLSEAISEAEGEELDSELRDSLDAIFGISREEDAAGALTEGIAEEENHGHGRSGETGEQGTDQSEATEDIHLWQDSIEGDGVAERAEVHKRRANGRGDRRVPEEALSKRDNTADMGEGPDQVLSGEFRAPDGSLIRGHSGLSDGILKRLGDIFSANRELSEKDYKPVAYYELDGDDRKGTAAIFHEAIEKAVASQNEKEDGIGDFVTIYPENTYTDENGDTVDGYDSENMRLFISEDGLSGFALHNGTDIISVFSHTEQGKRGVHGSYVSALLTAIANGGRTLDCYVGYGLWTLYRRLDFKGVAWAPYSEEQAPDGVKRLVERRGRDADVVAMYWDGDSVEETLGRFEENYEKIKTSEEVCRLYKQLPKMEYDDAIKYRDGLNAEREAKRSRKKTSWQDELRSPEPRNLAEWPLEDVLEMADWGIYVPDSVVSYWARNPEISQEDRDRAILEETDRVRIRSLSDSAKRALAEARSEDGFIGAMRDRYGEDGETLGEDGEWILRKAYRYSRTLSPKEMRASFIRSHQTLDSLLELKSQTGMRVTRSKRGMRYAPPQRTKAFRMLRDLTRESSQEEIDRILQDIRRDPDPWIRAEILAKESYLRESGKEREAETARAEALYLMTGSYDFSVQRSLRMAADEDAGDDGYRSLRELWDSAPREILSGVYVEDEQDWAEDTVRGLSKELSESEKARRATERRLDSALARELNQRIRAAVTRRLSFSTSTLDASLYDSVLWTWRLLNNQTDPTTQAEYEAYLLRSGEAESGDAVLATPISIDPETGEAVSAESAFLWDEGARRTDMSVIPEAMARWLPEDAYERIRSMAADGVLKWGRLQMQDRMAVLGAISAVRRESRAMLDAKKARRLERRSSMAASAAQGVMRRGERILTDEEMRAAAESLGIDWDSLSDEERRDASPKVTARALREYARFHAERKAGIMEKSLGAACVTFAQVQRVAELIDGSKNGAFYSLFVTEPEKRLSEMSSNVLRRKSDLDSLLSRYLGTSKGRSEEQRANYRWLRSKSVSAALRNGSALEMTGWNALGAYIYAKNIHGLVKLIGSRGNNLTLEAVYRINPDGVRKFLEEDIRERDAFRLREAKRLTENPDASPRQYRGMLWECSEEEVRRALATDAESVLPEGIRAIGDGMVSLMEGETHRLEQAA